MELFKVIEELIEEKGLDRATINDIICEGLLAAYERKYPGLPLRAAFDKETHTVRVFITKNVVASVEDEDAEISLRKARAVNSSLQVGDTLEVPFEGTIGRIEILRAKQVIAGRIHAIEAAAVFGEFKDKVGEIVHGMVHKCERGGVSVKLHETLAFLPKSLTVPGERCIPGAPIRAILKEVLPEPRHETQLILDRASGDFLRKLFELEVPEVFEGLVEIKAIARSAGYKSKVAVASHDKNIDPVGTCVGVGGGRIRPILKELGGEKIDVISWADSREELVKSSLKPAEINRVEIVDGEARVWLDEDQRSLAIGKRGQNIALASQLVEMPISLVQAEGGGDAVPSLEEAFE